MQNIDRYVDYRDFLNDLFLLKKSSNKPISYQQCSMKLKTSRSYLKLVFSKKRHISLDKINPICNLFQVTLVERQWILFLFLMNTTTDAKMKLFFQAIVSSYLQHSESERENFLSVLDSSLAQKIHLQSLHLIVLAMMDLPGFKWDEMWIKNKMIDFESVSLKELRLAMQALIDFKLVTIESSNKTVVRQKKFFKRNILPWEMSGYEYFKQGAIQVLKSIDLVSENKVSSPARFHLYYLSLSEADIKKISKMYDDLEQEILKMADKSKNESRVVMLFNNLIPITQK